MAIIAIQSQVVHGHVGNSAAVFPLQARGIDAAAVPTALFSNHPRYPSLRVKVLGADLLRDLLTGVEERGLADGCKVLISGYLGSPENGAVVLDFVRRAKARNPGLLYLCDPVMGDAGPGFYVPEDVRDFVREALVPIADVITPNQFELEHLVGRTLATIGDIAAAARGLGVSTAVVTGAYLKGAPSDLVHTIAIESRDVWAVETPRLSSQPSGTGDLFAALFAAALTEGQPTQAALGRAVSGVYSVLEETERRQSYEMALIACGSRLAQQEARFVASAIPTAHAGAIRAS